MTVLENEIEEVKTRKLKQEYYLRRNTEEDIQKLERTFGMTKEQLAQKVDVVNAASSLEMEGYRKASKMSLTH